MQFHGKRGRQNAMEKFLRDGRALMLRRRYTVVQALMSSNDRLRMNALCALSLVEWTEEEYLTQVADLGLREAPRA